ncbi:MAG TPA: DUF4097 family beta strand repeat-containing protein [Balneolaceae bacterium]
MRLQIQVLKNYFYPGKAKVPLGEGGLGGLIKAITFALTVLLLVLLRPSTSSAQGFSQTITKTAQFPDLSDAGNKFRIINVNGSVTIEAYGGETIELTVTEHVEGSDSEVEQAKEELEYRLERKGSLILAYLDAPFITLEYDEDGINYCINRDDNDYRFTHDVHIRVPRGILVEASTMNNGDLSITGTFKKIEARNLNGDVELKSITSQTFASTLNGDVTVSYQKAPSADSEFKTLNGTIDVTVPKNLSADIYFESLMGDFYTNFENLQRLEPEVQKSTHSDHSATIYRIDKFSPVRIGDGDIDLRFEVLNGEVYLRKHSSAVSAGEDKSPFKGGAGG